MPEVEKSPPASEPVVACDICGCEMTNFNCELICTNCGFRRDCSDP